MLYNVYIKASDKKQIVYALDQSNLEDLFNAISYGKEYLWIDGRKIYVNYDTIKIYDNSKALNKEDKSSLKDEIEKRKPIMNLYGVDLLKHIGMEVSHEFEIPLPKGEMTENNSIQPRNGKIFISHSSKDSLLVEKFVSLILRLGLEIPTEQIFCTSIEGLNIKSGEDFKKRIVTELTTAKAVIQIITENYKKSEVCLNEMGAAWVVSSNIIPLVADPFNFDVGFIHSNSQQLRLNNATDLLKLYDDHKTSIFPENIKISSYDKYVKDFVQWIESRGSQPERVVDVEETPKLFKKPLLSGLYIWKDGKYRVIPDNITLKVFSFDSLPIEKVAASEVERNNGAPLPSVIGSKIIQVSFTNEHWLIYERKRHYIPNVKTLHYLINNCGCTVAGQLLSKDILNYPQAADIKNLD